MAEQRRHLAHPARPCNKRRRSRDQCMTHVATLICNPAKPVVYSALVDAARAELPGAGKPQWLAHNIAADIPFTAAPETTDRAVADMLRERFAETVDIVVQPAEGRRKKLFLADMDSTMIG